MHVLEAIIPYAYQEGNKCLNYNLFPFIAVASGLAEIPLMLWLILMGVNAERWKE